ncbi:LLM class flavin-dependent oxidoreductase [Sphingobacterium rhinopitheci]|uniref:LLM class flavin-dependent oxidoreductase n=1 Tax=Sphingobacterium rhinopitheci TaxID=2781960 RepID=UPI001F52A047|nr:LLM class flavin-dependent oxidoreductase [Sphingobacterium rhinopitheci]MCI0922764.1 LLM class flavin-dependent oxidoreductase [Sphingobacterium rhinopitheci]
MNERETKLENTKQKKLLIRTEEKVAEIGWFTDIIGGDTEFLGVLDEEKRSTFEHCKDLTLQAEKAGFKNILFPTAYTVGQEAITFASAIAPFTNKIKLLVAIRTGEIHPPTLARALSNLDHVLEGRFAINIINSDLPGNREDPTLRYKRCAETIEILKQAWSQDRIDFHGDLYNLSLPSAPAKPYQQNGGPLLYFGGTSDGSRNICAKYCDVFLTWPEREESLATTMADMSARASAYGRTTDFGLRIHVVVRETEQEAREYAKKLTSKLDEGKAATIRSRGEDSRSLGVLRQDQLRMEANDEGYVEDILWTDIGKVFSGCGAGLVGSPRQIIDKLNRYIDMGFRAFIFSGFPLEREAEYFSKLVLPHLPNVSLSDKQNRMPKTTPITPYTTAKLR